MLEIKDLIDKFAVLDFAELGIGPKNLPYPNSSLEKEIMEFLKQFPALTKDKGYIDFLENYAGASLITPNYELIVEIFGFTPVSLHIVKDDGMEVDRNGFLTFALVAAQNKDIEDIVEADFAFDITQERRSGIYRAFSTKDKEGQYMWYCPSFLEWLDILVTNKGRIV